MQAYGDRLRIVPLLSLALLTAFMLFQPSAPVLAQQRADCLACHSDKTLTKSNGKSVFVDESALNASVHGTLNCTDCHKGLDINKTPHAAKIPPPACADCHPDQEKTFRHSYHGVANKLGDKKVATCASCHGSHNILPASDPQSSINPKNLPKTCGKCHPGVNANVTKGKIHVVISKQDQPALFYVSDGFKWLTICTMLALVGHIGLDLFSRFRRRVSRR